MADKITLNLSEYQPYKKMGQSCQLKDIAEFQVNWPKLSTVKNLKNTDLSMRYMCGNDIDEVVQLWKNVYPEAYGSTHQFVFDPMWYGSNVLLDENWEEDARKKKVRDYPFGRSQGESTCGDFVNDQMGSKSSGRAHHGWASFRIQRKKSLLSIF